MFYALELHLFQIPINVLELEGFLGVQKWISAGEWGCKLEYSRTRKFHQNSKSESKSQGGDVSCLQH